MPSIHELFQLIQSPSVQRNQIVKRIVGVYFRQNPRTRFSHIELVSKTLRTLGALRLYFRFPHYSIQNRYYEPQSERKEH